MQKGSLKRHLKSVHDGIKPFMCNICDYKSGCIKSGLKEYIGSYKLSFNFFHSFFQATVD